LNGKLISYSPGSAVIDIGGVGIAVMVPPNCDKLLNRIDSEVTLFTRLLVKEDELILYGFNAAEERKLFNLVLSVSGIGPKLALSLLGIFSVSQFYVAVLEENIQELCRAPGIGRKAAMRLVLELKEKLPKAIPAAELLISPAELGETTLRGEVIEALCALGYSEAEAAAAANRAASGSPDLSREDLLKLALRGMVDR